MGEQRPNPDIELPLVDEQWALDVLLEDEGREAKDVAVFLGAAGFEVGALVLLLSRILNSMFAVRSHHGRLSEAQIVLLPIVTRVESATSSFP